MMIRKILSTAFVFALITCPQLGSAQTYATQEGHAEVYGENAMTSYTGTSDQLEGWIDLESGELAFELELETLKTGNSLRDGHMYDALETDSFPKARFEGRLLSNSPEKGDIGSATVKGTFTIHGESKAIEVEGVMGRGEGVLKIDASFTIKITEYAMERPGYSFATVRDEHEIDVKAQLKPKGDQG